MAKFSFMDKPFPVAKWSHVTYYFVPPSITIRNGISALERVRVTIRRSGRDRVCRTCCRRRLRLGAEPGISWRLVYLLQRDATHLKLADSHATKVPPCRSSCPFGILSVGIYVADLNVVF